MSKILIAIAFLGIIFAAILVIPWPDITLMTNALEVVIGYTFTFNTVFPISTVWTLALLTLAIESGMYGYRLLIKIISYLTGHQAPIDTKK